MPLKAWSTTWRATCSASTTISAGCSLRPDRQRLAVLGHLLLEVAVLGAGKQTDSLQGREVLLGLGEVPDHQVGLAQIFVRAAMARIELQAANRHHGDWGQGRSLGWTQRRLAVTGFWGNSAAAPWARCSAPSTR